MINRLPIFNFGGLPRTASIKEVFMPAKINAEIVYRYSGKPRFLSFIPMNATNACFIATLYSAISTILSNRGPFAVFRRIWTIVVNSFNPHSFGAVTHIAAKCLKTIQPFWANKNTPAAIMVVITMVAIATSLFHIFPSGEQNSVHLGILS